MQVRRLVDQGRRVLAQVTDRLRPLRSVAARALGALTRLWQPAERRLRRALDDVVYGASYFGEGRDPNDRAFLSGYARYDRDTSNANAAAYLVWRWFPVASSLDVGCATGFVVEALRELDVDASGVDVSRYAITHPAAGARGV